MNLYLASGLVVAVCIYAVAVRTYNARHAAPFGRLHFVAFLASVACVYEALQPSLDKLADTSFFYHMVQHLILIYGAAPLLLLSSPVGLVLGASTPPTARKVASLLRSGAWRTLTFPVFSWLLFAAVMWGVHLSGLYEAALEHPVVHVLEHGLFFGSAVLFWQAVIHVGPVSWPMNFPLRIAYLFTAMPQSAFLGLALYEERHVLYAHYVAGQGSLAAALTDQQNAGALMWLAGGLLLFSAFMFLVTMWGYHERHLGERLNARLERGVLVSCIVFLAFAASPANAASRFAQGQALFEIHCSACHGANLEGTARAPSLRSESQASVDFWLSTGRMPASVPGVQDVHKQSLFNASQIAQITGFIMSRSRGDRGLPQVTRYGSLAHGREVFMANCAACHGATAAGSAIGYGWIAPSLGAATPLQVAEAVRTGPGMMPRFDTRTIPRSDLDDIVRYVTYLQRGNQHIGGASSAGLGPVAEGLFAWLIGIGALYVVVRLIGSDA